MSHAEIIARYGTSVIAERLGVPAAHVRVWKNRRIPRSAYAELIHAFPDITLADLKAGEPVHGCTPISDAALVHRSASDGAENPRENVSRTAGVAA